MSTEDGDIDGRGGDHVLVGEYVLGLLDAAAHDAMARRIAADPALQRELSLWQLHFSGLDGRFEEVQPPANVLLAVERRLFGKAASPELSGWWDNLALWRTLAAGATAAAVLAVGFILMRPVPLEPAELAEQLVAALQQEEGSSVSFVALYDPASGLVRLTALTGTPVPERDFELWAIQGSSAPVSMGLVKVEGRTEVAVSRDLTARLGEGTVLAVTLEPRGGSPTGAPTGPIVAKGAAVQI